VFYSWYIFSILSIARDARYFFILVFCKCFWFSCIEFRQRGPSFQKVCFSNCKKVHRLVFLIRLLCLQRGHWSVYVWWWASCCRVVPGIATVIKGLSWLCCVHWTNTGAFVSLCHQTDGYFCLSCKKINKKKMPRTWCWTITLETSFSSLWFSLKSWAYCKNQSMYDCQH